MKSRRDFLQFATVSAGLLLGGQSGKSLAAAPQLKFEDLLQFDSKGQITLLHITDIHGQLKPIYYRPPSQNYGVGIFEGVPPHLVGKEFLKHLRKIINPLQLL